MIMPADMLTSKIQIAKIRRDGATQTRAGIDRATVDEYAERMESGDKFPPVVLFHDGRCYWLADGFHRLEAETKLGYSETVADVRQGSRREAILWALKANLAHGLKRSNADKRRAVEMLLADDEWGQKSDRWIAEAAGVSDHLVASLRSSTANSRSCKREGQDGKQRSLPEAKAPKAAVTETTTNKVEVTVPASDPVAAPSMPLPVDDPQHAARAIQGDGFELTAATGKLRSYLCTEAKSWPAYALPHFRQTLLSVAELLGGVSLND